MEEYIKNWLTDLYTGEINNIKGTIENEITIKNGATDEEETQMFQENIDAYNEYLEVLTDLKREVEKTPLSPYHNFSFSNGKSMVLNANDMGKVCEYYNIWCTATCLYDNYELDEENAWRLAKVVRQYMDNNDLCETDAINEIAYKYDLTLI